MSSSLFWHDAWLAAAAFVAGVLNAMAGGGSFVSFPALLGMGVLPIEANATNTVALWPGQLTSIAAYWEDLKANRKLLWPVLVAATVGGVSGAVVLLHTGQSTFLHLVPWLLLTASVLFAVSGPVSKWLLRRARAKDVSGVAGVAAPPLVPLILVLAVVCFYIGYFGAGAGFLVISTLALFGLENLTQINALKVVATTIANGVAVVTFILNGAVIWHYCLLMVIASAIGGYAGARYSRRLDDKVLRPIVVGIGLTLTAYFFWKNR